MAELADAHPLEDAFSNSAAIHLGNNVMEKALTKQQLIAALSQSPHASSRKHENDTRTPAEKLRDAYLPMFGMAVDEDPRFYAQLICWNHQKSEVRDSKAALPVIALRELARPDRNPDVEAYAENALAHLADLNPKLLVKALDFAKLIGAPKNLTHRFVTRYLRDLEADRRDFDNVATQHLASLSRLYARYHVSRPEWTDSVLMWKNKETKQKPVARTGKRAIIASLATLSPLEIVAAIDKHKLPWLIARGAVGPRAKEPDVLMAFMSRMTAADLATSAKWLIRAGVKDHPQTRAAFEELMTKSVRPTRKRGTTLKTQKAAKVLADLGEEKIAGKLKAVQEKQLEQLRTIEGDWAVLGDRSGSMQTSIEVAKRIAAVLARSVKGKVHLIYFDTAPLYFDVTGKSLDEIERMTKGIKEGGGTSFACAMQYLLDRNLRVDGIALVSDGGENTPAGGFANRYQRYVQQFGTEPTVYWYQVSGTYRNHPHYLVALDSEIRMFTDTCKRAHVDVQTFDLRAGVDDYGLPNLITTMRVGRYSLLDEIQSYKLRTLDDVLTRTVGMRVLAKQLVTA